MKVCAALRRSCVACAVRALCVHCVRSACVACSCVVGPTSQTAMLLSYYLPSCFSSLLFTTQKYFLGFIDDRSGFNLLNVNVVLMQVKYNNIQKTCFSKIVEII